MCIPQILHYNCFSFKNVLKNTENRPLCSKPVAPPITEPTKPSDSVKPTEPTVAENSSVPADTQSPEIPKTAGDKLVCIGSASLIPFVVCALALLCNKKKHQDLEK